MVLDAEVRARSQQVEMQSQQNNRGQLDRLNCKGMELEIQNMELEAKLMHYIGTDRDNSSEVFVEVPNKKYLAERPICNSGCGDVVVIGIAAGTVSLTLACTMPNSHRVVERSTPARRYGTP